MHYITGMEGLGRGQVQTRVTHFLGEKKYISNEIMSHENHIFHRNKLELLRLFAISFVR